MLRETEGHLEVDAPSVRLIRARKLAGWATATYLMDTCSCFARVTYSARVGTSRLVLSARTRHEPLLHRAAPSQLTDNASASPALDRPPHFAQTGVPRLEGILIDVDISLGLEVGLVEGRLACGTVWRRTAAR